MCTYISEREYCFFRDEFDRLAEKECQSSKIINETMYHCRQQNKSRLETALLIIVALSVEVDRLSKANNK